MRQSRLLLMVIHDGKRIYPEICRDSLMNSIKFSLEGGFIGSFSFLSNCGHSALNMSQTEKANLFLSESPSRFETSPTQKSFFTDQLLDQLYSNFDFLLIISEDAIFAPRTILELLKNVASKYVLYSPIVYPLNSQDNQNQISNYLINVKELERDLFSELAINLEKNVPQDSFATTKFMGRSSSVHSAKIYDTQYRFRDYFS